MPAAASAAQFGSRDAELELGDLRGTHNAVEFGMETSTVDDQSRRFQGLLEKASTENRPIYLPPGDFAVANIRIPRNCRLVGVPGASRLVFAGGAHFLMAEGAEYVELTGVTFDGANRPMDSYAEAALRISAVPHFVIENCTVVGSAETGVHVERSSGRIDRCSISGAIGEAGILAIENSGFSITGNDVRSCSNGGILVHRWQAGEDGTIVTGNRVFNIGAANGGTGQWGNGINVFRAHSVMVANNQVSDCAFSAIRSNAGSNVQILGNNCLRSGETAIYSEFEFNGAVISNNIVDGAVRGVSVVNFMQGGRMAVVSGNLIRNIHRNAPYVDNDHAFGQGISVEADTAVTGNVIDNAESFGLTLGWGPYLRDVVAMSNVIRGSETGVYVSVVEGAGSAVISDNIISGWSKGAIIGHRWHDAVTGDMGNGDTEGFSHLTIERNRVS